MYSQTGDVLNAETSSRLILAIFNKTSPLHDGAVIIENDKVRAARVILPVTEKLDLPPEYGLRHRAGLGNFRGKRFSGNHRIRRDRPDIHCRKGRASKEYLIQSTQGKAGRRLSLN